MDADKLISFGQKDVSFLPTISSILSTMSASLETPLDEPGRAISEILTMTNFCVIFLNVAGA